MLIVIRQSTSQGGSRSWCRTREGMGDVFECLIYLVLNSFFLCLSSAEWTDCEVSDICFMVYVV